MTSHLPPTVFIIDTDVVSRTSLSNTLERNGFLVSISDDGSKALKILESMTENQRPHMVLINSVLDGLSAIEICTILKTKSWFGSIPIIMVAENLEHVTAVRGLENSFDDYIVKPFIPNDLISKVKLALGRSKPVLRKKVLSAGNIKIDLLSYRVTKNERAIHLGPTEFKLLQCFVENPTKIFSRQELIGYVWNGKEDIEPRTVDVHINRLRAALSEPGQRVRTIKTIRSAGYCLELPETVE